MSKFLRNAWNGLLVAFSIREPNTMSVNLGLNPAPAPAQAAAPQPTLASPPPPPIAQTVMTDVAQAAVDVASGNVAGTIEAVQAMITDLVGQHNNIKAAEQAVLAKLNAAVATFKSQIATITQFQGGVVAEAEARIKALLVDAQVEGTTILNTVETEAGKVVAEVKSVL